MERGTNMADRKPLGMLTDPSETADRAGVITCAVVWLIALALGVAAIVGLVDMATPEQAGVEETGGAVSTWWLWVIIAVSAVIIAGSIPLLVRARRAAESEPARRAVSRPVLRKAVDRDPPERSGGPQRAGLPAETLDRILLRGGVGVMTGAGLGMALVALGTLLMAEGYDTGAWVCIGVAGVITLALIAIPELFVKELKTAVADLDEDIEIPA